jgi:hypothetical protein
MSSDLTFLTNEPGKSLLDRFHALLGTHTQFFDCLVGYFMISGFYKLYPALEHTEKVRILIGLKTDQSTYAFLQQAKERQQLLLSSTRLHQNSLQLRLTTRGGYLIYA